MGEDVWISDNGGDEGCFLSLEEEVCDQNSADTDTKTIILQIIIFFYSEVVLLYRNKGVWVLVRVLHQESQKIILCDPGHVETA